ncbi:MAG TPA: XrtA system polysaccharide chain length determinant [Burkholderiaceae bacterium]|nr:XrtA system polysaccharide chain length determinant [Burkholderiaceae bacterium]
MDEILSQAKTIAGAMWHRRWVGLAVAWFVAAVGAVLLLRMPDRYEATARVYVDTQTVLKPLMAGLAVQPNIDEQIGMLARTIIARPNIEKIMHSANLDVAAATQLQRDQMVDELTKRIRFTGSGRENIYTITYQDTSPERSKRVVQDLLSLFVESGLGNKRRDSETARRFIDEQIQGYEQKLSEAENRLKEFKLKNLGFTGASGGDYFARMSSLSEQAAKVRLELRAAEQARDAYRRELSGEEPVMLPDIGAGSTGAGTSEYDARIDAQRKQLDELLRRFTDEHPDVAATRRLIAQLEEQRKQEVEARRKVAAQSPPRLSASTNPVFQQIKISLAEAEANVASLRARAAEADARVAQLRAEAGKAPEIEAELTQLNRDYEVLRKNYEQLVSRRESATLSGDVDSAGLAEFRIIDPPRVAPNPVFPNRFVLIPLVLLAALGAGLAASFAMARAFPTFHAVAALRKLTHRPVLGAVSMLETARSAWRRRLANTAFAGGFATLLLAYGVWVTWVSTHVRG